MPDYLAIFIFITENALTVLRAVVGPHAGKWICGRNPSVFPYEILGVGDTPEAAVDAAMEKL